MKLIEDLPGPSGYPLIGNLHQIKLGKLHRILDAWCREHGSIFKFGLGPKAVVVLSSPDSIHGALRARPNVFRRFSGIKEVATELGLDGVFTAEGDNWKRQRRLTAKAMDPLHLRQFFPTLQLVVRRLGGLMERHAETGHPVDVQKDMMRFTVDVTCSLAFGYDMNTLEKGEDVIQNHLERVFPALNRRVNAAFPYWRYFRLPSDRVVEDSVKAIAEAVAGFMEQSRQRIAENPELKESPSNLLEAMLTADEEGGTSFTDREIIGNALTMLLAGEDTTANTLSWMVYFMLEYPEVQAKMREEALKFTDQDGIVSDFEATHGLEYINAVANETLRMKSVAPIVFLETNEETQLEGVTIPAGTKIMCQTAHAAMTDAFFSHADRFNPERWIADQREPGSEHNTKAFLPFGAGPRFCPGRNLSMLEIKTAMAMICSRYRFESAANSKPVEEVFSFTMMPRNLAISIQRMD